VYIEKKHVRNANTKVNQQSIAAVIKQAVKIELCITTGIYVSEKCAEAVEQQQNKNNSKNLEILKISNITSSVRMIKAIRQLEDWPYQRSLIIPKVEDRYFHLSNSFPSSNREGRHGFNLEQSRAIDMSEDMYDDDQGRLRLMFGPPGEIPFSNICCFKCPFSSTFFV
jgi:hypothetical protein